MFDIKPVKEWKQLSILFLYVFALLFLCSQLSPLYLFNRDVDPNIYFTMGKSMMHGKIIYRDIFDHKGPLIFIIYGLGSLISHTNFWGVCLLYTSFAFVSVALIYQSCRFFVGAQSSFVVTLLIPFLVVLYGTGGTAEEFILMLEIVSLYFFLKYFQNPSILHRPWWMFIHGAMWSMAFMVKLNLVVFWIFILLAIFGSILRQKRYREFFTNIILFLCGTLAVFLPILGYFILNHALDSFWNGYIVFNQIYANVHLNGHLIIKLMSHFYWLIVSNTFLSTVILVGLCLFLFSKKLIKNKLAAIALVASFGCVFSVIFMTPNVLVYYYIPLLVFFMLGGIAITSFTSNKFKARYGNIIYFILPIFVLFIGGFKKRVLDQPEFILNTKSSQSLEGRFSKEIQKQKDPSLLVLGLNESISIFTEANITPNVKYFFDPNIYYEEYPLIFNSQIDYIKQRKIDFVIISSDYIYYQLFKKSSLDANYKLIDSYYNQSNFFYLYQRNK